jgi:predicted S18 family serine protease
MRGRKWFTEKLVDHKPEEHLAAEQQRALELRKLNDALAKNRAKNAVADAMNIQPEAADKPPT